VQRKLARGTKTVESTGSDSNRHDHTWNRTSVAAVKSRELLSKCATGSFSRSFCHVSKHVPKLSSLIQLFWLEDAAVFSVYLLASLRFPGVQTRWPCLKMGSRLATGRSD
jgi:hypothetical protein